MTRFSPLSVDLVKVQSVNKKGNAVYIECGTKCYYLQNSLVNSLSRALMSRVGPSKGVLLIKWFCSINDCLVLLVQFTQLCEKANILLRNLTNSTILLIEPSQH